MSVKQDYIDYSRIGRAQTYYKGLGFKNIEVPWFVSKETIYSTLPDDAEDIVTNRGSLIGSGEQGFIELMKQGQLEPGRWQTTTPCYRDEKEYNELTRLYFLKTELIWYMPEESTIEESFKTLLDQATDCFFEISEVEFYNVAKTDVGYDIELNGIELGSYGVRRMNEHLWIYGTGLAEPRFSIAVRRQSQIYGLKLEEETSNLVENS